MQISSLAGNDNKTKQKGFLDGTITKIVVETDEEHPKTIAVITNNGDEILAGGYRIRYTPKYD